MEEKDWIGMDCCPICGEPRGLIMNQRMSKTLPKYMCSSIDLCDKCLKDAKENGWFILYETTEKYVKGKLHHMPTGRFMKLNFEALSPEAPGYEQIDKIRVCLTSEEDFNNIYKGSQNASTDDSKETSVVA